VKRLKKLPGGQFVDAEEQAAADFLKQVSGTPKAALTAEKAPAPERFANPPRGLPPSPKFLPDPLVAERYSVDLRTLDRWDKATEAGELDFPPAIYVRGRKFRELGALELFEKSRAAAAATDAANVRQELVRRSRQRRGVEATP
jgi:hypothetical protein